MASVPKLDDIAPATDFTHPECGPSPASTENFFREAELNFTNVQLLVLKSNGDTLQS
jgi:hypothetical protein